MRVLAALSGGVDSAVAAARAVDAGHDVTAVHLALSAKPLAFRDGARGCCSVEDSRDARRVADVLDVPFYVWDVAEEFRESVVDDFVAEYEAGRTPNPCLRCNEQIKFSAVLDRALALGFDAVATGHYARLVVRDGVRADEGVELHRAADPAKDQSYVLAVVPPERLAHAMFPLGDSLKVDVRAEAARRGLAVADKPDSHDICFVTDGDTAGFLRERLGLRPGSIVEADGTVVGTHDGAYAFTVGQRRGLRLGDPAGDGRPRYVLDVSPVSNTVTVGPAEALDVDTVVGDRLVVLAPDVVPEAVSAVDTSTVLDGVAVQIRAHGAPVEARVELDPAGGSLMARLAEPLRGVAPGQGVVVYAGTRVIASATVASGAVA